MKTNGILKLEGVLQLILLAVPFLVLVLLWDQFPQRVAIHWGLSGEPNGWADKSWGLLLLPLTNVGLASLTYFLPRLDARLRDDGSESALRMQRALKILRLATTVFMTAMALLIDVVALGWKVDVALVVNFGILLLFAVMGIFLPMLGPNRVIGIRTPWTRKSPEVWTRTHRVFGRIMLIGALGLMPVCLLVPMPWSAFFVIGFVMVVPIGAMIYSYVCYRSLPIRR